MSTHLKHTLNPIFALLFAVGVDRLYKLLDPLIVDNGHESALPTPDVYIPLTMILTTLWLGTLTTIANDRLIEKNPHASAWRRVAWLSYFSIACILYMFYVSVDRDLVLFWWIGYAALCAVNAVWNALAVESPHNKPHIWANAAVGLALMLLVFVSRSWFSSVWLFYFLLLIILIVKLWQRNRPRWQHLRTLT